MKNIPSLHRRKFLTGLTAVAATATVAGLISPLRLGSNNPPSPAVQSKRGTHPRRPIIASRKMAAAWKMAAGRS